jgi:outer membrane protein assembly factor BamD (BamD/ComL family)
MRTLLILTLALSAAGCTRWSLDHHLNNAYRAYEKGECAEVMLELSQAERKSRSRRYLQPEISLLRGQCLERQKLFVDAAQTYRFIVSHYPASEYAFRARARLETLRQLGHHSPAEPAEASSTAF